MLDFPEAPCPTEWMMEWGNRIQTSPPFLLSVGTLLTVGPPVVCFTISSHSFLVNCRLPEVLGHDSITKGRGRALHITCLCVVSNGQSLLWPSCCSGGCSREYVGAPGKVFPYFPSCPPLFPFFVPVLGTPKKAGAL